MFVALHSTVIKHFCSGLKLPITSKFLGVLGNDPQDVEGNIKIRKRHALASSRIFKDIMHVFATRGLVGTRESQIVVFLAEI